MMGSPSDGTWTPLGSSASCGRTQALSVREVACRMRGYSAGPKTIAEEIRKRRPHPQRNLLVSREPTDTT